MGEEKIAIGRIVLYRPTLEDKHAWGGTYSDVHRDTPVASPAIIVAVWSPTCVNLRVFVDDATNPPWVTSSVRGDEPGQWNFPVR